MAQSVTIPLPPTRAAVDGNGVDLASGQLRTSDVGLSIGTPGAGGLVHSRSWFSDASGSGWRHQHMMLVKVTNTGKTIVTVGAQSVGFNPAGSGYTADQGEGATLTATATTYIYTSRDGTVITFDRNLVSNNASYYGAASFRQLCRLLRFQLTFTKETGKQRYRTSSARSLEVTHPAQ